MGKQNQYTSAFKIQTVQNYLQGNLSANQLAIKLGIHPHTVRNWIRIYKQDPVVEKKIIGNGDLDGTVTPCETELKHDKFSEISIIFSKMGALELEINELKTILLAYLIGLS